MACVEESGYTYDMRLYWGKDSCFATDTMQLLDIWLVEVKVLNTKYLWTFLSPRLFHDWDTQNKFKQYQTVQQKRHASWLWTPKKLKFKSGDKAKDQGMFVCISLEGQATSVV